MTAYEIIYEATITVEAPDIATAVEATPPAQVSWTITVDGHDFDPSMPLGCSAMIYPGSRIDPPEMCDRDVVRWDDRGDPWCDQHSGQLDPFEGRDI